MKRYVLDSFALLAYCEGEVGAKTVAELIKKGLRGDAEIFLCVVNWGEIYYIAYREGGAARAELYRETISRYPITIVDVGQELTLVASKLKAIQKISYADAYAAALAKTYKAELVTGDPEFASLEKDVRILWIRK